MNNKLDRYFASIYLAIVGDKIGFGNGNREQNNLISHIDTSNKNWQELVNGISARMVFEFIAEGGISGIILDDLRYSDDTVMHLDTIIGLISTYSNRDELYNNICKKYLDSFKDITFMRDVLLAGRQTIEAIKNINSGMNWKTFAYNKLAGGNGGAMRTMCLGLVFNKTSNLIALIESSIMISSIFFC